MKKFLLMFLVMFSVAAQATLEGDITAQGNISYFHKNLTAQQIASMIRDYETLTAADTLANTECGKTVFLNSATEFATTLPAPVAGCMFVFIVNAAPVGTAYTVVTNGGSNVIQGTVIVNGASVNGADEDTITFAAGAAVAGDWVQVISDGTNWYIRGTGSAIGAITLTAT